MSENTANKSFNERFNEYKRRYFDGDSSGGTEDVFVPGGGSPFPSGHRAEPEVFEPETLDDEFFDPTLLPDSFSEPEPEPVTPAPVETVKETVREVVIVPSDQARELGYGGDVDTGMVDAGVDEGDFFDPGATVPPAFTIPGVSAPSDVSVGEPAQPSTDTFVEEEEGVGGFVDDSDAFVAPPTVTTAPPVTPQPSVKPVSKPAQKQGGLFGGLFGGGGKRSREEITAREETSVASVYEGEKAENIEIVTGFDAREERLRLTHDSQVHRDIDPSNWLNQTMQDALAMDASDLHIQIEGESRNLRARIRVDGQMRDFDYVVGIPAQVIMGRLKAATDLNSGRVYAPQETIYTLSVDGEDRKARVVIFGVEDGGEAMVMRLPLTGKLKQLDELAFAEYNLQHVYDLLAMPYKLIMIAGPMGSGKTTTAHGALLHVANPRRTVWTIEDPVERSLPNIVQLEVDDDNDAGFEVLLGKLLRADYNTLFLGEIRDDVTAAAAVKQAKAGRQVMSTIHADDNIKALMRLIELAKDSPLSVLSSVGGVISQRLVRKLNPEWDGVDPETKYKGRVPIHEILFVTDEIVEVMMDDRPMSEIKQAVSEARGSTFSQDAHRLIGAGVTDHEEIVGVIGEYE